MTQKISSTIILLFTATTIFAQSSVSIIGKWKGKDKRDLVIEIYKATDGLYYGKNPKGKIVLRQLQFDAGSNTYKGKMIPTNKGISLDVTLFPESSVKIKLVGKGKISTKIIFLTKIN